MCGIVGQVTNKIENNNWIEEALQKIEHRGPDDHGTWISEDKLVSFAHRRLSIIDLSSNGHQPMKDEKNNNIIIFNGEIYNFTELKIELRKLGYNFFSKSDTEVILAAYDMWGKDCISKFNGMFAFAIYDFKKQIVLIARDRSGEKPLFYYYKNGCLYFASELKALLSNNSLPRRINYEALDCYLSFGYIPSDICILEDFKKLPPASAIIFDFKNNTFFSWKYWDVKNLNINNNLIDENELLCELEYLLGQSVEKQLVSDVNVGVLLSGGVDSSLITAMAAKVSNKVETFTISIPGYPKFDETTHARLISNYFGTKHTELEANIPNSDLLFTLAKQYDEPIIDSSIIPTYMVSQLISKHCKVALGGDGGDELFGGYGHYTLYNNINLNFKNLPLFFRQFLAYSAKKILPVGFYGRNWLQLLGSDFKKSLPIISPHYDPFFRKMLLKNSMNTFGFAEKFLKNKIPIDPDLINRSTKMDFENYLSEIILVKVDRASMLNSLEIRAPFLDSSLIEFAFSKVPSRLKVSKDEKKILLKRLAKKILPPQFDLQRKQGFSIPLASWISNGEFKDLFNDILFDSNSIYHQSSIQNLFDGQKNGRRNEERLFGLVMLELWKREYKIDFY